MLNFQTEKAKQCVPGSRTFILGLLSQLAAHLVSKFQQFVLHRHGLRDQGLHVLVGQQMRLFLKALLPQTLLDFRNEKGVFLDLNKSN